MENEDRLRAIFGEHEEAFFAEHPAFDRNAGVRTHNGRVYYATSFIKAYTRWLAAHGYLTREELLGYTTIARQVEHQGHNQAQWDV